jgi:hypothetical protein
VILLQPLSLPPQAQPRNAWKHLWCSRQTEADWEKRFANLCRKLKVKKKAHAGRGQEIKWEIPIDIRRTPTKPYNLLAESKD